MSALGFSVSGLAILSGFCDSKPYNVYLLTHTYFNINACLVCFCRLQCPPIPALSSADWFFPTRRSTADSAPPLPIQTSPMLSKLHSQSPSRGK